MTVPAFVVRACTVLAFIASGCTENAPDGRASTPPATAAPSHEEAVPERSSAYGEGCEFRVIDVMASEEDAFVADMFVLGPGEHRIAHPCWDGMTAEERADKGYEAETRPDVVLSEGMSCSLLFASDAAVLRVTADDPGDDLHTMMRLQGYAHPWMEAEPCWKGGPYSDAAVELSLTTWCPTGALLRVTNERLGHSSFADEAGRRAMEDMRSAVRRNGAYMTERRRSLRTRGR